MGATASVFAERMVLIQGTYLQTNRIYKAGSIKRTTNFAEIGVNITSFVGKNIGLYSSATFLKPYKITQKINGTDNGTTMEDYDALTMGIDALLGIGFLASVTPGLSILAAGGVHFNGVAFTSSDYLVDPFLKYNLGPGVAVNGLFNITKSLNINISAMGAWDFLEFLTMPETETTDTVSGGITWAISAGLGVKL